MCNVKLDSEGNARGVIELGISHLDFDREVRHCRRCIVELSNELDARGVMLNLASLISVSIWNPKRK